MQTEFTDLFTPKIGFYCFDIRSVIEVKHKFIELNKTLKRVHLQTDKSDQIMFKRFDKYFQRRGTQ